MLTAYCECDKLTFSSKHAVKNCTHLSLGVKADLLEGMIVLKADYNFCILPSLLTVFRLPKSVFTFLKLINYVQSQNKTNIRKCIELPDGKRNILKTFNCY